MLYVPAATADKVKLSDAGVAAPGRNSLGVNAELPVQTTVPSLFLSSYTTFHFLQ